MRPDPAPTCRCSAPPRATSSAKCYGDRFIPDRSAMDMDMAHYLLTETKKDKENAAAIAASPSKEAYRRLLAEKLLNNRTRILALRNKPPEPENIFAADTGFFSPGQAGQAEALHSPVCREDSGCTGPRRRLLPQPDGLGELAPTLFRMALPRGHLRAGLSRRISSWSGFTAVSAVALSRPCLYTPLLSRVCTSKPPAPQRVAIPAALLLR
ncbi:unnamed protein product [Triticum aestivum]|nr:hypothetical protein CFC21_028197 [Triticum aestivum]SPT16435.1 unnamed protein product [Triticum aestivum]